MAVVGNILVNLSASSVAWNSGLQQAKDGLRSFTDYADRVKIPTLNINIQPLRDGLATAESLLAGVAGAVGVGLSVEGLREVVSNAMDAAENVRNLSQAVGIATDQLTALHAQAFVQANLSAEEFDSTISKLLKNLGAAAVAGGPPAKALDRLGLSLQQVESMNAGEAFSLIADRISKITSPMERAVTTTQLFGREGQRLLPLLQQGAAGMAAFRAQAENLGVVIPPGDIATLADANEHVRMLQEAATGAGNQFAIALAPEVARATDVLRGLIPQADVMRQVFQSALERIQSELVAATPELLQLGNAAVTAGRDAGQAAEGVARFVNFQQDALRVAGVGVIGLMAYARGMQAIAAGQAGATAATEAFEAAQLRITKAEAAATVAQERQAAAAAALAEAQTTLAAAAADVTETESAAAIMADRVAEANVAASATAITAAAAAESLAAAEREVALAAQFGDADWHAASIREAAMAAEALEQAEFQAAEAARSLAVAQGQAASAEELEAMAAQQAAAANEVEAASARLAATAAKTAAATTAVSAATGAAAAAAGVSLWYRAGQAVALLATGANAAAAGVGVLGAAVLHAHQSNITYVQSLQDLAMFMRHPLGGDANSQLEDAREQVAQLGNQFADLQRQAGAERGVQERLADQSQLIDLLKQRIAATQSLVVAERASGVDLGSASLLASEQKQLENLKRQRDSMGTLPDVPAPRIDEQSAGKLQQDAKRIQDTLEQLRRAAETAGMGEGASVVFKLQQDGASPGEVAVAQLDTARAAIGKIVAQMNDDIARIGMGEAGSKVLDLRRQLDGLRSSMPAGAPAIPDAVLTSVGKLQELLGQAEKAGGAFGGAIARASGAGAAALGFLSDRLHALHDKKIAIDVLVKGIDDIKRLQEIQDGMKAGQKIQDDFATTQVGGQFSDDLKLDDAKSKLREMQDQAQKVGEALSKTGDLGLLKEWSTAVKDILAMQGEVAKLQHQHDVGEDAKEAKRMIEESMTPLEKYQQIVDQVNRMAAEVDEHGQHLLTAAQQASILSHAKDQLDKAQNDANRRDEQHQQVNAMERRFSFVLPTGGHGDHLRRIAGDVADIKHQLGRAVQPPASPAPAAAIMPSTVDRHASLAETVGQDLKRWVASQDQFAPSIASAALPIAGDPAWNNVPWAGTGMSPSPVTSPSPDATQKIAEASKNLLAEVQWMRTDLQAIRNGQTSTSGSSSSSTTLTLVSLDDLS